MAVPTSIPSPIPLTLRGVTTRAVQVPLTFALGTSAAVVRTVPLLLLDLQTEEGPVGHAYVFCYTPAGARAVAALVDEAAGLVAGQPVNPLTLTQGLLRRYALLGVTGALRMALSALDVALWDAAAIAAGRPLAELLGAERRPLPAYDSRGLGLMPPERLGDEALALLADGLNAIKLRLGYPTLAADLAAVHAVRAVLPDEVRLMVDYNQALVPAEALRRGLALQREGVAWLEEPIRHDDYRGCAELAARLDLPVQIGENFNGPEALAEAVAQRACDLVMPDVMRIGGVTGWLHAAGIAAAHGLQVSSHLVPEISVHLLAASPTAHWVEYVDWADALLEEPLPIVDGCVTPPDRPGLGLAWDEAKLRRLEAL